MPAIVSRRRHGPGHPLEFEPDVERDAAFAHFGDGFAFMPMVSL
jgi:hypothetical protein